MQYGKQHANGYAFAATLGAVDSESSLVSTRNLCIEFMFEDTALERTNDHGHGLVLEFQPLQVTIGDQKLELTHDQLNRLGEALGNLSSRRRIVDGKKVFAEDVVPTLDTEAFAPFRPLFARALEILECASTNG